MLVNASTKKLEDSEEVGGEEDVVENALEWMIVVAQYGNGALRRQSKDEEADVADTILDLGGSLLAGKEKGRIL